MNNQELRSSQLINEKDGPNERSHITKRVSAGVRRCAVEVIDHSLVGFGIYPADIVIVILRQNSKLKPEDEGKLLLVKTPLGPLLRVAERRNKTELTLYSGNQLYPVRGYKLNEVEILGYASYFDRHHRDGRWIQLAVPDNLLLIASTIQRG